MYAFEPFASTYELLVKNIQENHLADVIVATQAACHEAPGVGQMHLPDGDDLGPAFVTRVGDDAEGVRLARIDDIVPAERKVELVKMDIEGSEPFVFAGMPRIIQNDRPVLFTEFIPGALGQDPHHYLRLLHDARYKLYEVHDFLEAQSGFQFDGGTGTVNLVCLPVERVGEFSPT